MRITAIVFIFIISLFSELSADYKITPWLGSFYNSAGFDAINKLQEELVTENSYYFNYKVVDSFNDVPGLHFRLMEIIGNFSIGPYWEFSSTGGRIDYRDFSGHSTLDIILNHNVIGFIMEDQIIPQMPARIKQYLSMGASFDQLKFVSKTKLYGIASEKSTDDFKTVGIIAATGLSCDILEKPFLLRVEAGGQLAYSRAFHLKENNDGLIHTENGKVMPKWSGIHIALLFGWNF